MFETVLFCLIIINKGDFVESLIEGVTVGLVGCEEGSPFELFDQLGSLVLIEAVTVTDVDQLINIFF